MVDVLQEIPDIDLSDSIREFSGSNADYYVETFTEIQNSSESVNPWNMAAAVLGPIWCAARGLWTMFWLFTIAEMVAIVQIGKGIWGDLGAEKRAEAEGFLQRADEMVSQAAIDAAAGDDIESALQIAHNLQEAAQASMLEAETLGSTWSIYLLAGLVLLGLLRFIQGRYANRLYELQYSAWRVNSKILTGFSWQRIAYSSAMLIGMVPISLYRFTVSSPVAWTTDVPANPEVFTVTSLWLDGWFDRTADLGVHFFDAIVIATQSVLDAIELALVDAPWPVVALLLVLVAWRVASIRVAIFTAAALFYIGMMGLWEASMVSIVMVGTAAAFCIVIGIPLGIWFSRSERAYAAARPILDLMQTIPPFVYLIPIIAFFGTGRVPGVIATVIFAMPPVIRLTALGMRQVSPMVKEAATAFGATPRQVLTGVELPLARPAIMTGVNQTILMSLSMVVIASLIGAKGLGQEVLIALQYVAKGQGILAGLAILFCAMMLDRIVQGRFQRQEDR